MTKTERLYYADCYLREFEARVLRSEPAPNGFRVYLDRTAFYPTSGGQPTDTGTIAGILPARGSETLPPQRARRPRYTRR